MSSLDEIRKVFGVPPERKKPPSKSQTLRSVLFLRWEREIGIRGALTSEEFYNREMDKIIGHQKNLL